MLKGKVKELPETFESFVGNKEALRHIIEITMPKDEEVDSMSLEEAVPFFCKKIGLQDFKVKGQEQRSFVKSEDVTNSEFLPLYAFCCQAMKRYHKLPPFLSVDSEEFHGLAKVASALASVGVPPLLLSRGKDRKSEKEDDEELEEQEHISIVVRARKEGLEKRRRITEMSKRKGGQDCKDVPGVHDVPSEHVEEMTLAYYDCVTSCRDVLSSAESVKQYVESEFQFT